MKKILSLLLAGCLLAACDNVAQFSESIPDLGSRWETATAQITEFASTASDQKFRYQQTLNNMRLTQKMEQQLSRETMNKLSELGDQYAGYGDAYSSLSSQVESFISQWQEKSGNLLILQEGLETGKLPADAPQKISSLEELVTRVSPTLADWKNKLEEATSGSAAVADEYKMLLQAAMEVK